MDLLYNNGGIYMDVDELLNKPIDDIINNGEFLAYSHDEKQISSGLIMGFKPGNWLLKQILDIMTNKKLYSHKSPIDLTNSIIYNITDNRPFFVNEHLTKILMSNGFVCNDTTQKIKNITIYKTDFFNSYNGYGKHLYLNSWK